MSKILQKFLVFAQLVFVFCSIVTQIYVSLHLKVCYKDVFQTLQHDRAQSVDVDHLNKIS